MASTRVSIQEVDSMKEVTVDSMVEAMVVSIVEAMTTVVLMEDTTADLIVGVTEEAECVTGSNSKVPEIWNLVTSHIC